jgi:hypothetical protein
MKKVIFIGGTAYSGSTLFGMILANDSKGFSCGEVQALFRPWRPHHFNPTCGCGDNNCSIWKAVLRRGEQNLNASISQSLPGVEFITISSKDPIWINSRIRLLKKQNVITKNILIWKTPLESGYSFNKRGKLGEWEESWINYHRTYFTLISSWKSVKYYDLITDKSKLQEVCEYLEIPWCEGKENFWEKRHHTLFGNTSAKIHLYSQGTEQFNKMKESLVHDSSRVNRDLSLAHKSIYYEQVENQHLKNFIDAKTSLNKYFSDIVSVLEENDVGCAKGTIEGVDDLKIGWASLQMRRVRKLRLVKRILEQTKI